MTKSRSSPSLPCFDTHGSGGNWEELRMRAVMTVVALVLGLAFASCGGSRGTEDSQLLPPGTWESATWDNSSWQ